MNKFNQYGETVLEYRAEFLNKEYSKLIHNSLKNTIEEKYEPELASLIKDTGLSDSEFKKAISKFKACLKSEEELKEEYQEIIDQLFLEGNEYDSHCNVADETIEVTKEYLLDETFFQKYFDVQDDITFEKLMKKNGIFEKFAMLRLSKIFKDFIEDIDKRDIHFQVKNTSVFFDSIRTVYGIYLDFIIPIDYIEDEESEFDIAELRNKIKTIIQDADIMFAEKMKN